METTNTMQIAEQVSALLQPEIDRMIKEAVNNAKFSERDEWFDTKQAAAYLGWKRVTLYTKLDEVPCTKIGGTYRFSRKALDKYIKRK